MEKLYRVYDSRDKTTLFVGSRQECLNYMDSQVTFGESEYVWLEESR